MSMTISPQRSGRLQEILSAPEAFTNLRCSAHASSGWAFGLSALKNRMDPVAFTISTEEAKLAGNQVVQIATKETIATDTISSAPFFF